MSKTPQQQRRAAAKREYDRERVKFLEEHRVCQAKVPDICGLLASQIQHLRGRVGSDYLDKTLWMAVCGRCQGYITEHPKEAIENGWALPRIGRGERGTR